MEYDLENWAVFCASNSGRTREMISYLELLRSSGVRRRFGLTAREDTPMETLCEMTHVLTCGWENAVAATKSVVEQALFYHSLVQGLAGKSMTANDLDRAADAIEQALQGVIPAEVVEKAASASRIYFAGRNNGVAEELTLKTNEITRLPSAYLEGTYAVHGIEEVMSEDELVVVVDPFDGELDKFKEVLEDGVGMTLVAISTRKLSVPTMVVPRCDGFDPYVQLAAGWNLLVETGLARNVDLDTPARARKVGNETAIAVTC
jgi:glucosamine--fructose-6-phosphate aminotransferase (isomerizing)